MIKGKTPSLKKVPGKKKVEIVKLTKVSQLYTVVYQINTQHAYMEMLKAKYEKKDNLTNVTLTNSTLTRVKKVKPYC